MLQSVEVFKNNYIKQTINKGGNVGLIIRIKEEVLNFIFKHRINRRIAEASNQVGELRKSITKVDEVKTNIDFLGL